MDDDTTQPQEQKTHRVETDWLVMRRKQLAQDAIRQNFGSRYVEASLSRLLMPEVYVLQIQKWLSIRKHMLVYLGHPGTGKTFLVSALTNYCCNKFDSFRVFTEKSFLEKLHGEINQGYDGTRSLRELTNSEFFIYDDLGSSGFTDWRKGVLFEMIDLRYGSELPTVITSNLSRKEIVENLDPRILSRLFAKENTIIENDGEDKRQHEN